MPFVNDPDKPGRFDPSKMTGEEQEAYGKVCAQLFLLKEAVKELAETYNGSQMIAGMMAGRSDDNWVGVVVEWRIEGRK